VCSRRSSPPSSPPAEGPLALIVALVGHDVGGWKLAGELMAGVVWCPGGPPAVPPALRPLPGPRLIVAARYTSSPVGPYLEMAVAEPARLGPRPAMCVTTMVVDSAESRTSGRQRWGFPKKLATLSWSVTGRQRSLRWEERGLVVRWTPIGPALPAVLPLVCLQQRAGIPLWIPGRVGASAGLARVEFDAPAEDDLSHLAGRHLGAHFPGASLRIGEGRPLPASSGDEGPATSKPAGRADAPGGSEPGRTGS